MPAAALQPYSSVLTALAGASYATGAILIGDGDGTPVASTVIGVNGSGLLRVGPESSQATLDRISVSREDGGSAVVGVVAAANSSVVGARTAHRKSRGTVASPAAVNNGDRIGDVFWEAHSGSAWVQAGSIVATVNGTYTTTPGAAITLKTRAADAATELQRVGVDQSGVKVYGTDGTTVVVTVGSDGTIVGNGATWFGGSVSGGNARVDSTSHPTKGNFYINGTQTYVEPSGRFRVDLSTDSFAVYVTRGGMAGGFYGASTTLYFGTESNHAIGIYTNNTNRWYWSEVGHYVPATNNIFDLGSTSARPRSIYVGTAVDLASGAVVRGAAGSGVDAPGGALTIDGGAATGNAAGGAVLIRTTAPGSSGSTPQTPLNRVRVTTAAGVEFFASDGSTVGGRVAPDGYYTTRKTTAPADADLVAGELAWWFDATNGAAKVKFKGKSADGTVVSAELAMS